MHQPGRQPGFFCEPPGPFFPEDDLSSLSTKNFVPKICYYETLRISWFTKRFVLDRATGNLRRTVSKPTIFK
jgi:hypothetical protein